MVTTPDKTPVITPVVDPAVASRVLLLLHVPPPVRSLRVIVDPTQTRVDPVIATGSGLTVIGAVT